MTDLFRGYDLTTVADRATKGHYERVMRANTTDGQFTPWEEVDPVLKHRWKSDLLPIITDVLEALESDDVKPTEAKQMVEYGYLNGDRKSARFYENQEHQHNTETATVWTLHLNVHPDLKDAVLERMAVLPETTGEYTWDGDSFTEWGTNAEEFAKLNKTVPEYDQHMAIYFDATPKRAREIGDHLADHAVMVTNEDGMRGVSTERYVSTSGDYAEQV